MPAATTHRARYSLLTVHLPGREEIGAGVLLEDPATDQLHIRMRRDWGELVPEESEVFAALGYDLSAKALESGAAALFEYLETTLSNVLRIGDRHEIIVEDFERSLDRLYRQNVSSNLRKFVTHLPHYSLAVAAGPFWENREVEKEEDVETWEETPPRLRLTKDMFVARVQGRSMEPLIPDGALCVFRSGATGSRQGRLVLVEDVGGGPNDRHTVKRYRSVKVQNPDHTWAHDEIWLDPLNPEFESWKLEPEEERYRILAEFVQVLD